MRGEVLGRMRRSSEDFLRLVWPVLGKPFGKLIPVETVSANAFAKELDARAGIDHWLVGVDGHMRGLASRTQWPERGSYGTFTIRVRSSYGGPTEYHKRKREIASAGALRPHYICHAYIRCTNADRRLGHRTCSDEHHTELLAAGLARMDDVIEAVDARIGRLMPAGKDGTQGWAVPWDALRQLGCKLVTWPEAA